MKKKIMGQEYPRRFESQNEAKTPVVLNSRDGKKQMVSRHKPSEAAIHWIDLSMDLLSLSILESQKMERKI